MNSAKPAAAAADKIAKAKSPQEARVFRFYLWLAALRGARRQGFAFICGAAAALALPPFYLLPLPFLSFAALVFLLDGIAGAAVSSWQRLKTAALTGWSFGFGYFTAGLWWPAAAMTVDLAQFWWAIPFAALGLPAFLSLYYALAALLALLFWRQGLARIAALAAAFALAEYLRGALFTGFPWNAVGLTIMPCPLLMQADGLLGQNGMNAAAVFVCALPALWLSRARFNSRASAQAGLALFAGLIAADIGYGAHRLWQTPPLAADKTVMLRVRLVQPDIAQEEKQSKAARAENFARLLQLTQSPPKAGGRTPDLVIWPETAMPYLPDYNQAALARISAALKPNQLLLTGAVRTEAEPKKPENAGEQAKAETERYRFYNSMMLISAGGRILAHADKVRLVPFGEYLPMAPLLRRFGLNALAEAAGPYSAAASRRLIRLPNGVLLLPLICYEVIFPEESRPIHGEKADIIVNITNDAWFGRTPGPYQHLAQAQLRAIEQNRPLLRAANNGISAYIDARGRVLSKLPLQNAGFLDITLPVRAR